MDEQTYKLKESCLPCMCYMMNGPRRCVELGNSKFIVYALECPCVDCLVKVMCHRYWRDFCPYFREFKKRIIAENCSVDSLERLMKKYPKLKNYIESYMEGIVIK